MEDVTSYYSVYSVERVFNILIHWFYNLQIKLKIELLNEKKKNC